MASVQCALIMCVYLFGVFTHWWLLLNILFVDTVTIATANITYTFLYSPLVHFRWSWRKEKWRRPVRWRRRPTSWRSHLPLCRSATYRRSTLSRPSATPPSFSRCPLICWAVWKSSAQDIDPQKRSSLFRILFMTNRDPFLNCNFLKVLN